MNCFFLIVCFVSSSQIQELVVFRDFISCVLGFSEVIQITLQLFLQKTNCNGSEAKTIWSKSASSSFFVSFLSLLVQHDVMSISSSWFLANLIEGLSTSEHQCFPFWISSLCHLYIFLRLVHSITPFEENKSFLEKVSLQNHSSLVNTCLRSHSRPRHYLFVWIWKYQIEEV